MKIAVLLPKQELSEAQQQRLAALGEVVFVVDEWKEYPVEELIPLCQGAVVLAVDPDIVGGIDSPATPNNLRQLIDAIPTLRGVALDTTAYHYIDLAHCKEKGIVVTYVPGYATESVAEQTIGYVIGAAKRILHTIRQMHDDPKVLLKGMEVGGKTLGILGLGRIGTRVAELAHAIGMKVVAWNRTPKIMPPYVELDSVAGVLKRADIIVLALKETDETRNFLSAKRIEALKPGAIVINPASAKLVDEQAMAEALKEGRVDTYVVETDDVGKGPLASLEGAFQFPFIAWYTKEALSRAFDIWIDGIEGILRGIPINKVPECD